MTNHDEPEDRPGTGSPSGDSGKVPADPPDLARRRDHSTDRPTHEQGGGDRVDGEPGDPGRTSRGVRGGGVLALPRVGAGRLAAYAVGAVFIGIGLSGVVAHSHPFGWAVWVGVPVVAHDGLLAPVVLLGAVLLRPRWKPRFGLFTAGALTLVALPLVLGYGRHPDNPSILPLDYLPNLMIAVALVAAATAVRWRWVGHVLGTGIASVTGRRGRAPRRPESQDEREAGGRPSEHDATRRDGRDGRDPGDRRA